MNTEHRTSNIERRKLDESGRVPRRLGVGGPVPRRLGVGGFSLVELLVVISIIALLTGLIATAVNTMIKEGARAKAATQCVAVANAVKAYRSTYAKWPGQTQGVTDGLADPRRILNDLTNNSRRISFLEVDAGQVANGYLLDPWKRYIEIAIDENEDGFVTIPVSGPSAPWLPWTADGPNDADGTSLGTTNVEKQSIIVMSWGPIPGNSAKRVKSWNR